MTLRLTVSLTHARSGAEILLHDSGPLVALANANAAEAIEAALDQHAGEVERGGVQLVIRLTDREFVLPANRPVLTARRERRGLSPGEF